MASLLRRLIVLGLAGILVLGLPFAASPGAGETGQVEDFETGDFSHLPWRTSPAAPWSVQSDVRQSGTYAARAGHIEDSGWSWLQVQVEVTAASAIGFWYRVSSEPDFDFLRFLVDGVEVGKWSGETGWQPFFYLVTPGKHTFRWEYAKDNSDSAGEDTAWVDSIVFPVMRIPSVAVPACTITVQPHQSIQEALYRAPNGAVICLSEGTWKTGHIVVGGDIVLRGAGPDKTILELGPEPHFPNETGLWAVGSGNVTVEGCKLNMIEVKDSAKITIINSTVNYVLARDTSSVNAIGSQLESVYLREKSTGNLTDCSVGAFEVALYVALYVGENAALTMTGCEIYSDRWGIEVSDRAKLRATGCRIAAWFGVTGHSDAVVTLESTIITGGYGVMAGHGSKMTLTNCTIAGCGGDGVKVTESAQVILEGCRIVGNGWMGGDGGVTIGNEFASQGTSPRVSLNNCIIEHNYYGLLVALISGTVEVRNTTIRKNGVHPKTGAIDSFSGYGIFLGPVSSTELTVVDSTIVNNAGWGISAHIAKCGYSPYPGGDFTGKVVLKGTNVIEGNGQGQVCIP
jgi:hypothetical protein